MSQPTDDWWREHDLPDGWGTRGAMHVPSLGEAEQRQALHGAITEALRAGDDYAGFRARALRALDARGGPQG